MIKMFQMLYTDTNGNKFSLVGSQDTNCGWWDYSVHYGWLPSGPAHLITDHFKDLPLIGNPIHVAGTIQDAKKFDKVITLRDAVADMI